MILALPEVTVVTVPLEATVATAVLLLDQAPVPVPPRTTLLAEYVAVVPVHRGEVPVTEAMDALG